MTIGDSAHPARGRDYTMTSAGVTRMPLPTPFPVGRVNCYLAATSKSTSTSKSASKSTSKSKSTSTSTSTSAEDNGAASGFRTVLVDVGVKSERSFAALESALAMEGIRPGDIEALLVTHPHYDHSGGAATLASRHGWQVHCHEAAVRLDMSVYRQGFHDLLVRFGAPEDLIRLYGLSHGMADLVGEPVSAAPALRALQGGEIIKAGALSLEVLHTPGHDAAHLCYLAKEAGLIFLGDLLLAHITPNPLPHFVPGTQTGREPSIPLYLASLDRVEALGPLVGLTGHGALLPDTARAARRARAHILARSDVVLARCREHPGENVVQLSSRLFPKVDSIGQMLAFSEVLAHCDYLHLLGRVHMDPEHGGLTPA